MTNPGTLGNDTGTDPQTDETANADTDKDGFAIAQGDCNDANADIHPNAEEICGDGIDQNCDGKDAECPAGENARVRVSVVTGSGENDISEIWLNIQQIMACGEGGCQVVGGSQVVNLLDAANSAISLADMALSERKITHLRFVLGADNRVVKNGESHSLKIPSGEQSGLKVQWDKTIAAGELAEILLAFDLENAVALTGDGYMLHPVIRTVSQASAAVAAQTAVVSAKRGGKFRKGEKLEIEVPDGAVDDFSILWGTEAEGTGVTPVFTMGPEGTVFKKPVKVKLSYDPAKIPEGYSENSLVILHDGEAIATVVDAEANTLEGEIAHFSTVEGGTNGRFCIGRKGLFDKDDPSREIMASGPGPNFTHTWPLINNWDYPISNYTIRVAEIYREDGISITKLPLSGFSGSYTSFSLVPEEKGSVTANFTFDISDGATYTLIFDIIKDNGEVLCYSLPSAPDYGRLNSVIGANACVAPPPTVDSADHASSGNMSPFVKAEATAIVGDPELELNGKDKKSMEESSDGGYVAQTDPESTENEHKITVQGECNQEAYLEYLFRAIRSEFFGFSTCLSDCAGSQKCGADPVNTAIGNFVHQENDAIVAGLGNTDIRIERTYNSQALLSTPASMTRFYPDGSSEVIAEPPQYFGKGWTSVFGEYLLKIDMEPVFKGVQILYSDGHTANFKKEGDEYVADSPGNHDLVVKEGSEYVLYRNGCKCSQDSRRFNSDGKLTAISDKNGNEIKLIYAGSMLAAVENASGRRIEFEMNGEGRIIKAKLPEGITLSYEYEDDMLTAFTDGRGLRTVYKYDDKGQMTEIVSPKGHPLVRNSYDEEYRVSEQTVGEKEKYTFAYEKELTRVADAYGHTTVHHYDEDLRLVQIDHPDGNTEYYEYDENNNRTEYRDQAGAEWKWTYDENGNRLTADGPLGWHREWQYNDKNQVVRMTENVDATTVRTTTFEYDSKGNLTRFCNPLGGCGSVTYDALGQPIELKDFAGNATIHAYDAEGDLISVTDAVNAITRFSHDGLGRTVSMTKPEGSAFSYSYDKNSNLTDVNGPMGWHISFAFDANDNLREKTDPNGGKISYEYNASDRPVRVKNQLAFDSAAYAYGLMNEITGITDAEGRYWTYAYDELLRVTQVSGPLDTHFYYAYNPVGKITDMTDANGIVTHTDYDALYRPLSVIRNYRAGFAANADTNVTVSFAYNLIGNVMQSTDPEGYATRFVYDLMGQRTKKTDAEGYEWVYSYDPMGNLEKVLNPRGFDSLFAYTRVYQLQKAVNPEGHAVSYLYDPDGRLTDKTDAMNVITHFAYDDLGRMVEKVRNYLPGHAGDSQTNVTTAYAYDLAGNLRFLTNPLSHQAEFVYDAAHRRTDFSDFEKGLFRFAYDKVNNLLSVTDAENNPTLYVYDALNRLISRTNAENETERYAYDKMGNRTHLTEADGTVTLYGYDFIYRLNSVTQNFREGVNPGNDVNALTRYAYDARGLLTQIVNANNAATSFAFDKVGNMIEETDPIGNVWDYEYDGMGNRTVRTDAKRDRTEYAYYPDDMLEEIRYANGQAVQYVYDANNNRTDMKDWLGNTAWEYDPLNRITWQKDPHSMELSYAYDAASNRTAMIYPEKASPGRKIAVNYTWSPNNWMSSLTYGEGDVTQYERDKVGNILHIMNSNGTRTDITYDDVYRTTYLLNKQVAGAGKENSEFTYDYNKLGHVTSVTHSNAWRDPLAVTTEAYQYDGLHRLNYMLRTEEKNGKEKSQLGMSYLYDAVGNRKKLNVTDDLATNTPDDGYNSDYDYDPANRLLSVIKDAYKNEPDSDVIPKGKGNQNTDDTGNPNRDTTTEFVYDNNGNRISKTVKDENGPIQGIDYAYDPENRLIEVQDFVLNGHDLTNRNLRAITTMDYDGGGRRLVSTYDPKSNEAAGVKKRLEYVFDGLDPVAEYEQINGPKYNDWDFYYRGAMGRIVSKHHFSSQNSGTDGQKFWYHYNFKGDVSGLTKQSGQSHHNYDYDPYGSLIPENGKFTDPHNHYTLTGKEYDENTGLIWFGARHYDPGVGGWVTQDLYRGRIIEPMTLHRYGYVNNNPINFIDSYGFSSDDKDTVLSNLLKADIYFVNPFNPYKIIDIALNLYEIIEENTSSFLRDEEEIYPSNDINYYNDSPDWCKDELFDSYHNTSAEPATVFREKISENGAFMNRGEIVFKENQTIWHSTDVIGFYDGECKYQVDLLAIHGLTDYLPPKLEKFINSDVFKPEPPSPELINGCKEGNWGNCFLLMPPNI